MDTQKQNTFRPVLVRADPEPDAAMIARVAQLDDRRSRLRSALSAENWDEVSRVIREGYPPHIKKGQVHRLRPVLRVVPQTD